jgi:DNA-binding beta-propeller fold protein YncE
LFATPALAGPPTHLHTPALDIGGFNRACGAAVDSKGDVYVASAGESKVRVFDPAHKELASIENTNEPCGLAVNGKGELFVTEQKTGNVVRYKPNAYPFVGTPTYGAAEAIDSSGEAKGIAVDPHDDRLYVAEGDHLATYEADGSFEANVAEGELANATGVATYTYLNSKGCCEEQATRYLFVADDAASDQVKVFSGSVVKNSEGTKFAKPKLRRTITGPKPGEDFGFGPEGGYLAVDPGNANEEGKCVSIADQACTAGHLLVYDAAHKALDEFEASGEFLDRIEDPAFADAKPTAIAIDRSGGPNDGTIYVSAGDAAGSKLLAFGPLAAPSRAPRPELSHVLTDASAVAVDPKGYLYVAASSLIHVFDPSGKEIAVGSAGKGIEDANGPSDLAVDSSGKVYVADGVGGLGGDETVTYYTPKAYPPVDGTTYARHEPPLVTEATLEGGSPERVAIDPSNDHLLVTGNYKSVHSATIELDSAANESKVIRSIPVDFGASMQGIGVHSASGNIYVGETGVQGGTQISVVEPSGTERLARINGTGAPNGPLTPSPAIAVDQSNGHVLTFANPMGAAREYDASGAFVAEFSFPEPQGFTKNLPRPYDIAIDSSGGPNDGTAYVAFDDAKKGTPDVWAFAPLTYGETPLATTGIASAIGEGNASLNGTVNPRGFELTDCRFEYLSEAEYEQNEEDEDPLFEGAEEADCAESLAAIGKGSTPVPVHAEISGLDPEGRYRFRLAAENKYGPSLGQAALFGPPVIETKTALPILYDEATLRAKIDPSGLETEYRFEYGTTEAYGQSTPTQVLSPSAGPTDVAASLTGLAEGTTYHFRVVAENEALVVPGPDQAFATQERPAEQQCTNTEFRTGLSAKLPECRAYELVTPAETNGLSPHTGFLDSAGSGETGFNNWLATPRGPAAGERLSYFTLGTLPGFDGNGVFDGYRAQRGAGEHPKEGWTSQLFAPTYEEVAPNISLSIIAQRSVASDQLYSFWRLAPGETFPKTLEAGSYLRTPAGFEPLAQGTLGTDLKAESRYVSPGGAHVVFLSSAQLEEDAPPAGTFAVYERAAGSAEAEVVSLLPGEVTPTKNASYVASTEDGTAILFKLDGALYLRRGAQTVEVAEAPNTFAGISEDGGRVFYADAILDTAQPQAADLFVCEVEAGPCTGGAEPLGRTEIAPDSVFVNVSADGSKAFFTSKEAGTDNLYAWEAGTDTTSFVSQLDPQDFKSFIGDVTVTIGRWTTAINPGLNTGRAKSPARSTPEGDVFVFQSHAKLTAYDNEGHGEIYRYEPAAPLGEQLTCVSCDPSGATPSADAMLADANTKGGVNATTMIANLTDDGGTVFFESADRLLPEDANSVIDVYEWQANGAGSCKRPDGCLALISSGQGEGDSHLYGMSADGHDVFFRTREKLVGQDIPGSPSIYDARIGGGIPDPPLRAPCQADACQGQGTAPPALPSPASTAPTGEEKVISGKPRPRCPKGKRKVRSKGKVRCVKRHRANHDGRAGR